MTHFCNLVTFPSVSPHATPRSGCKAAKFTFPGLWDFKLHACISFLLVKLPINTCEWFFARIIYLFARFLLLLLRVKRCLTLCSKSRADELLFWPGSGALLLEKVHFARTLQMKRKRHNDPIAPPPSFRHKYRFAPSFVWQLGWQQRKQASLVGSWMDLGWCNR